MNVYPDFVVFLGGGVHGSARYYIYKSRILGSFTKRVIADVLVKRPPPKKRYFCSRFWYYIFYKI